MPKRCWLSELSRTDWIFLASSLGTVIMVALVARAAALDWRYLGALLGLWAVLVTVVLLIIHWVEQSRAEAKQRARHLTALDAISQAMRATLDLPELLETIYQHVSQLLDARSFYIALYDADTQQVSFPFCYMDGKRCQLKPRWGGNSLVEHLIRTKQPLLIRENVRQTAAQLGLELPDSSIQAWLGVPLVADERLLGGIVAHSPIPRAYDSNHLKLLTTVASQASIAVRNAQLYSTLHQHAAGLAILNSVSAAVNSTLDLERVLEIVVTSIGRVIGCQKSAIFLLNEPGDELYLAQSHGLGPAFVSEARRVKVGPPECELVAVQRQPLVLPDVTTVAGFEKLAAAAKTEGFRGMAQVPLMAQNVVIGTLVVYFTDTHPFTRAELDLLEAFANQAAAALNNARLYARADQALARRVEELAALEAIGCELTGTLDLRRVADLIVALTRQVTGASAGSLLLLEEGGAAAQLVAHGGYLPERIEPLLHESWPLTRGIAGRVFRAGEVVNVPDVRLDPDYFEINPRTLSQLGVPIIREGRTLGVIMVESTESAAFDQSTVDFVRQLANQAAAAIENARLFQAAAEGRDRLRAILDSSRDGTLVFDITGRVVMANPSIEKLLGVSQADMEGRSLAELLSEPGLDLAARLGYSPAALLTLPERLERSDLVETLVYQVVQPSQRFIERSVVPVVDSSGTLTGWMITLRDVTEERTLQQARDDLTSMIIHDLRGPLVAILSGLQILGGVLPEAGDAAVREVVTAAERSCHKLLGLVNSLLDVHRIEAGRVEIAPKPINLAALVSNVLDWLAPLVQERAITVVRQMEAGWSVMADEDMISRVLMNLLDNALKFTPLSGRIIIDIGPAPGEEGFICCAVNDTGPGIPPEYRERIFDRFFHGPADLLQRRGGAGLGLAFCKLAVQAHGGRIWVESGEQGSTFYFTLPVAHRLTDG